MDEAPVQGTVSPSHDVKLEDENELHKRIQDILLKARKKMLELGIRLEDFASCVAQL